LSDPDKVKLGAHLAPGTTVAHNGVVEHNAGTQGRTRVEQHVTAGNYLPATHGKADTHGREAAMEVSSTDHLAY